MGQRRVRLKACFRLLGLRLKAEGTMTYFP